MIAMRKSIIAIIAAFMVTPSFALISNNSLTNKIVINTPVVIPTLPPAEEVKIESFSPDWNLTAPIDRNNPRKLEYHAGAVGLKCEKSFLLQDLRALQFSHSLTNPNSQFLMLENSDEEHVGYLKRIIARVDRVLPSFGIQLREAFDKMNLNYQSGKLVAESFPNSIDSTGKCQMVRFSLRKHLAYGVQVYIDRDQFFSKNMTISMRAAILLHDIVATHFFKDLKNDEEVVFSGIVAELMKDKFDSKGLLSRLESFGYQLKDTYAYKSVAEYRSKLMLEKAAYVGMLVLKRENEFYELRDKTIEMAVELQRNLTDVQRSEYADTHLLDNHLMYPQDGIEEGLYAMIDMTKILDRLFTSHDREIYFYKEQINILMKMNSTEFKDQIAFYVKKIREFENMKYNQKKLRDRFDSLKRLTNAFVESIKVKLVERLKQVHAIENEKIRKSGFLSSDVLTSVMSKREEIFKQVLSEINAL